MSARRGALGGDVRCKQFVFVTLLVVALLGFSGAAFGQATGTLTGTVTDPKGLAMTGVSVVVRDVATGVDHAPVTTNDTGVFVVPLLQPGNYDVTASQTGFSTVKRPAVNLQVGQTIRVDIEMPVSAQQTLVTVTTEIPILETEKTEQSANINENLVSNLPVSSRRWEQLALLTGGTTPDGTAGAVSFHGLAGLYNNNTVDGAANTTYYDQTTRGGYNEAYVYSSDSVREFSVKSSGFGAELGQAAGGSVNAVTRSGTAQFHGDVFYNGRTPGFNAFDPVNAASAASNGTKPTKNVLNQNQWGGSLGGPIVPNKLFFFFNNDGFRKNEPQTITTSQLNPGLQGLTCPTIKAGSPVGATAPSAAQCQAAKNYILAHSLGVFPRKMRQDIFLVKLDWQINQANHFNVVTNSRDYALPISGELDNNQSDSRLGDRFVIANWTMVIGSNKVNELRYQWAIDNTFGSNNLATKAPNITTGVFSYGNADSSQYQLEHRTQISDNFSWTIGSHSLKFGADINLLEDKVRGAVTADGPYAYGGSSLDTNTSCVAPNTGSQSNNTAFCNWLLDLFNSDTKATVSGKVTTIVGGVPVTTTQNLPVKGQHFATLSQTHDNVESTPEGYYRYIMPTKDVAGYITDVWKIRSNLTLNLGLRYDVELFPPLPNGVKKLLDEGKLPAGSFNLPILDFYTTVFPNEYLGIAPRVGLAWNFRKNTVLRVSGGEFFAETAGHNLKNVFSGAGEATTSCKPPVQADGNCPSTTLQFPQLLFDQNQDVKLGTLVLPGLAPAEQPFLPASMTATIAGGGVVVPNPLFTIRGADPGLKRPRAWEASIGVEQQLPWNMNLSVTYSFTRGLHLPRGQDGNIGSNFDPNLCTTPAVTAGSTVGQTCGVFITKPYTVLDSTGAVQNNLVQPILNFYGSAPAVSGTAITAFSARKDPLTGGIPSNTSTVNTRYNGMVISLRKPMRSGLEILANYTYSHATDNGTAGAAQLSTVALDPRNNTLEQGNSSTDVRNRFTASFVYVPNFGQLAQSGVGKQVLGGWSLSSSVTATNGGHITGGANGSGSQSVTYCGVAAAGCTYTNYFAPGSTTALTSAQSVKFTGLGGGMAGSGIGSTGSAAGSRISWVPRGGFVLPNLYNVDMRLAKEFAVKERYHFEIRLEAFNVFNTTLRQGLDTNAFNYSTCGNTTCMVPRSTFLQTTTTSTNNLGARQMQAGFRFDF